eukprot:TRINITY_DN618_c1_g1_i3.p2 TRINITY_DN618_c1_g1~~TRINITY_DN618_c1_g1_i3.p2  ORF type:complete len:636 (+),score=274.96 TRINITY_DN618_c1_g1_i3:71-1978(+)
MATPQGGNVQNASLYVGDLAGDVNESNLFDVFREKGPVLSIRVCRDSVTRKSLGYAYVNFQNVADAEKTIEEMNFCKIKGRTCRIMWCKRDPSLRKSGVGNIFIKNLAPTIDNKALHDTFLEFGEILSCKVVPGEDKDGKVVHGFGFVHFATQEAADKAVSAVDGMMLADTQVFVGKFERKERKLGNLQKTYTNCYVKHFDPALDEAQLKVLFEKYGSVNSVKVQSTGEGEHKRSVAFVSFESHDAAVQAVDDLHDQEPEGFVVPGKQMYVARHQKKGEREHFKKAAAKARAAEYMKYTNLYVKNLDDTVTSQTLRDAFKEYGEIVSAKVMYDKEVHVSKGFGFVCFKDSEAANTAVTAMNGRIFSGKPLYVSTAQRKDARKAQLEQMYKNRQGGGVPGANMGGNQGGQGGMGGNQGGPNMQQNMQQRNFMQQQQQRNMGAMGMGMGMGMGGKGGAGVGGMPRPQMMGQQALGMGRGLAGMPGALNNPMMNVGGMGGLGMGGLGNMAGRGVGLPGAGLGQPGLGGGLRPNLGNQMGGARPGMNMPGQGQLNQGAAGGAGIDPARLATLPSEKQRTMLGERLFSQISKIESEKAAKITGMLLEMDVSEIMNLLEGPELLRSKVVEAVEVLNQHATR